MILRLERSPFWKPLVLSSLLLAYPGVIYSEEEISREDFLREYVAAQKKVRDFYNQLYLEASCTSKRSVLSGPDAGSTSESTWSIRYWSVNSKTRIDRTSAEETTVTVGFWDMKVVWFADLNTSSNQVLRYSLGADPDERWWNTSRASAYPALIPFCLPFVGWPVLEEALDWPEVRLRRISREKTPFGDSVRIFLELTDQQRSFEFSLWLRPDLNFVTQRAERAIRRGRTSWEIEYQLSDEGIPLVRHVHQRYDGPSYAEGEEGPLVSSEVHCRVTDIRPYRNGDVFSPRSVGVSTFTVWWSWLRFYWRLYAIGHILFYLQLLLVVLLISSIAYRRWRRRRLAGIGGGSATAPA